MFKKNDKVSIIMFRDNPQLGHYMTFNVEEIIRVAKKSFVTTSGKRFDIETGNQLNSITSIYGSTFYRCMPIDEAKKLYDVIQADPNLLMYGEAYRVSTASFV